jgi:predicted transcriptional regulator of viral defense system
MIIDHIKPHYEVRVVDTDPDTGDVSSDMPIALTTEKRIAYMIALSLNQTDEEPNRVYYTIARNEQKV